jgi:hypothetical protein
MLEDAYHWNCLLTGSLISEDKILQVMPSVVLSLHLLCERRTPDSIWKPYLDILPDTYTTPLYFTLEDLKYLKGSPAYCMHQLGVCSYFINPFISYDM